MSDLTFPRPGSNDKVGGGSSLLSQISLTAKSINEARRVKLRSLGLYPWQEKFILLLKDGKMAPKDIVNLLSISPPTVHKTGERLMRKGILEEFANEGDGRSIYYILTEVWKECIKKLEEMEISLEKQLLGNLHRTKKWNVSRVLTDIREKVIEIIDK